MSRQAQTPSKVITPHWVEVAAIGARAAPDVSPGKLDLKSPPQLSLFVSPPIVKADDIRSWGEAVDRDEDMFIGLVMRVPSSTPTLQLDPLSILGCYSYSLLMMCWPLDVVFVSS